MTENGGRGALRALALPWLAIAGWFAVLAVLRRDRMIGDETVHTVVVRQIAGGDWSRPANLPMLPIFHGVVATIGRIVGTSLTAQRFAAALIGCAFAFAGWAVARGRRPSSQVGMATAQLAFLPFLFPFVVLVYSDTFSLLFLVLAVLAFERELHGVSGLLFAGASLVRQANVVWALFFVLWALLESRDVARGLVARLGRALSRSWPHVVVLLTAVALAAMGSSLFISPTAGNEPRFNLAQYYVLAWAAAVVWAPVLLPRTLDDARAALSFLRRRPELGFALLALCALAIGLAMFTYENDHLWNRGRGALQNYPLVAMTRHRILRPFAIASVLWIYYALGRFLHAQRSRVPLAAFAVGLVAVAPMGLVEPRYYLPLFVVATLLVEHDDATTRRFAGYYGIFGALSCLPLLRGLIW